MRLSHSLPRRLVVVAVLLAALGLLLLLLTLAEVSLGGVELGMTAVMAPILVAFGVFKGALARDAQLTLAAGGPPAAHLVANHGSPANVRQWIVYKYSAAFMGVVAGAVIIGLGLSGLS